MKHLTFLIIAVMTVSLLTGCFLGASKIAVFNDYIQSPKQIYTAGGGTETYSKKITIIDEVFDVTSLGGGTMTDWVKIKPEKDKPITVLVTSTVGITNEISTNHFFGKLKKGEKYVYSLNNGDLTPYVLKP